MTSDTQPSYPPSREFPRVSVLVPVCNEANFIERCIKAIANNDYPKDRVEILVLDGASSDDTADLVRAFGQKDPRVFLLSNPQRQVSVAMNIGIREAQGEIILRVDGHAIVQSDFIRRSVEALLTHPNAWCAGGVVETVCFNQVGLAIAAAMSSPAGVGNATFRIGGAAGYVDTIAFGAYWHWVFEKIGLFDEELVRNQDDELNLRLNLAGGRIFLDPSIRTLYYARSSFDKLARQYYQYGFWRIRVIQKHNRPATFRQIVPLLFVSTFCCLAVAALFSPMIRTAFSILVAVYVVGLAAGALAASRKTGAMLIPQVAIAFIILHFGYGFGSASGIFHFLLLRRSARDSGNHQLSR